MSSVLAMDDIPPSPRRWSLIPFDILGEWEISEKRFRLTSRSSRTHISDLPEPILAIIFSLIFDSRTRNSMSVVCSAWYSLERATRTRLRLRGSVSELFLIPRSFQAVERLDLSQCWPWGNSLFQCIPGRAVLVGQVLKQAFPRVKHMTIYARDARDIEVVACFWPEIRSLKLVRWHQRPMQPEESSGLGMEFRFLMQNCHALRALDLSQFYCWTEDIPPALEAEPSVSRNLRSLNLMKVSGDGFKALELEAITNACSNLEELRIGVVFDPRFLDFVGDSSLVHLATGCTKLRVLHLIDGSAFEEVRGDPSEGFSVQDAQIGSQGLVDLFEGLPLLEELAIVLTQNVRDSGPVLEKLASNCKRLRSLRLGHFHGICSGFQSDGVALCSGLVELVIRNSADLNDMGLVAIASGCTGLRKLGLHHCKEVSKVGCRALTAQLSHTLLDVEISCCLQINEVDTLWTLHPIRASIQHLHLDCLWDDDLIPEELDGDYHPVRELDEVHKPPTLVKLKESVAKKDGGILSVGGFTGMDSTIRANSSAAEGAEDEHGELFKSSHNLDLNFCARDIQSDRRGLSSTSPMPTEQLKDSSCDGLLTLSRNSSAGGLFGGMVVTNGSGKDCDTQWGQSGGLSLDLMGAGIPEVWSNLKCLSLWIPVGKVLSSLPIRGLRVYPHLQEIRLKVEGDARRCPKPRSPSCGLATFAHYPALSKLILDCSETTGYALSCPPGQMELSLWERWYLQGIEKLSLRVLEYWPPQDRDANRRGISLPAAGLISNCPSLRVLVLHGTAHEHFLRMFLNIPNLRDVQVKVDYYPAPEELNTELRADSFKRFEANLIQRGFPD